MRVSSGSARRVTAKPILTSQTSGVFNMGNVQSTRAHEHRLTGRRNALAALDADLAMREMLRALSEAIEVLDERSLAFEVCTMAFCKHARRLNAA
jgi:hypothetical protein